MAEITADRVFETSTTTGTGSYTLAGAISGYQAFSAVCANGDTVRCFVEEVDANGVPNGGWEVGIYTWGTGGTLARTTIEKSSNANAAVSWSAGTRRVGLGITASKLASIGGLSNFSEAVNSSSPNGSNNAVSLSVTGGSTIADLVLKAKSTGAILAQVPDGTAAGGNKRGLRALDMQMARGANTQVASGNDAVVLGNNNTASAAWSVAIGYNNNSSNSAAFCAGNGNAASGAYAISLGSSNTSSGGASLAFGTSATSSGDSSFAAGNFVEANADWSVALGYHITVRAVKGASAFGSGPFTSRGDAQRREFVMRRATTNATASTLGTDGGAGTTTNQVTLPTGSAVRFRADVVARNSSTGDAASWTVAGLAKNVGGTVTLVGTPSVTMDFNDSGASTWVLAVSADNTNKAVAFTVTGIAATNIKWVTRAVSVEAVG